MVTLTRRSALGVLAVLATGSSIGAPAAAQDGAALISGIADRVMALLRGGAPEAERERVLSEILRESFDLRAIGRTVLGRHWNIATPEQQEKFIAAFEKAEVKAYSGRFKDYSGQSLVVGKVIQTSPKQLVSARIDSPNGETINMIWEVVNGKIVDVVIEGVSMAITRRSDFNSYIQRNGIDGLIAELQRRGS